MKLNTLPKKPWPLCSNIGRGSSHERPSLDTLVQLFIEINMLGTRMSDEDLKNAQALLKG